ncbi:MAG: helix-turn-helix domain-containing protein [Pseudomonadota bacterium]
MIETLEKGEPPQGMVRTCSIWRALEVLGDVPSLLILEAIWLGVVRFEAIRARTCLSKPLVSERLKSLVQNGIIRRSQYSARPPRFEFVLEEKGRALFPVTMMLLRWEKAWSSRPAAMGIGIVHKGCGAPATPVPLCAQCGEAVHAKDIAWQEGPGLGWMEPSYTRRRQRRNRTAIAEGITLFTDAAEVLGDRWSSLVMRSAFTGLNKFDEMLADSAMASNILSDRLGWLVENGFLKARVYQTKPDRFAYYPTAKAYDYLPILLMLQQWGDRFYAAKEGPPLILRHKTCGAELTMIAGCGECGGELKASNIRFG